MRPIATVEAARVDRTAMRLEHPVPTARGVPGQVGRCRDVGPRRASKARQCSSARIALGKVAPVQQDIAARLQGAPDRCERRGEIAVDRRLIDPGRPQPKFTLCAVADDVDRRNVRLPGKRRADLVDPVAGPVDQHDLGLIRPLARKLPIIVDAGIDKDDCSRRRRSRFALDWSGNVGCAIDRRLLYAAIGHVAVEGGQRRCCRAHRHRPLSKRIRPRAGILALRPQISWEMDSVNRRWRECFEWSRRVR